MKYVKHNRNFEFFADFDGIATDDNVQKALNELKQIAEKVTVIGTPTVPWFPT